MYRPLQEVRTIRRAYFWGAVCVIVATVVSAIEFKPEQ
jgi:hypothetical protein